MNSILTPWAVTSVSFLVAGAIVPGVVVSSSWAAVKASVVLAVVDYTVKPLLHLIALPISLFIGSLVSLFVNAISLYFVSYFTSGFTINSFLDAVFGSIVMYAVSMAINLVIEKIYGDDKKKTQ